MHRVNRKRVRLTSRLSRAMLAVAWVCGVSLALAPNALAAAYGRGLWGGVNDKVVTDFGFIMILGFPLLILIFSLVQWRLDKRKEARKAAEKALMADVNLHGGW